MRVFLLVTQMTFAALHTAKLVIRRTGKAEFLQEHDRQPQWCNEERGPLDGHPGLFFKAGDCNSALGICLHVVNPTAW
jgi:hypothetical protein